MLLFLGTWKWLNSTWVHSSLTDDPSRPWNTIDLKCCQKTIFRCLIDLNGSTIESKIVNNKMISFTFTSGKYEWTSCDSLSMTHSTSQAHSFFHYYYYRQHPKWITFTPSTKRNGFRLKSDENNILADIRLEFGIFTKLQVFDTYLCCLLNRDLILSSVFVNNLNRSNEIWWITRNHRKVHIFDQITYSISCI